MLENTSNVENEKVAEENGRKYDLNQFPLETVEGMFEKLKNSLELW